MVIYAYSHQYFFEHEYRLSQTFPSCIIRELSDVTRDGQLNLNEFIVACKLIQMKLRGNNIPPTLPGPLLQLLNPVEGQYEIPLNLRSTLAEGKL